MWKFLYPTRKLKLILIKNLKNNIMSIQEEQLQNIYDGYEKDNMKLEKKHLLPYLAYDLKAIDVDNGSVRRVTLLHFSYDMKTVGHNHLLYEGLLLKKHKPILRPLSDLTNEEEGQLFGSRLNWLIEEYSTRPIHSIFTQILENNQWVLCLEYFLFEHLLEWHFDVFGLIEKGLAIDINTI
jgi:hypothetical protein